VVEVEVVDMKKSANAALGAAMILMLASGPARAESSEAGKAGADFGIGLLTVLTNVPYMPVKIVYAVLGGVTGSLAYGLTGGNREVADGVWVPSMGGDYVLTTDMMTGEEEVHFNGVRERPGHRDADSSASEDGIEGDSREGTTGDSAF
jgi:hypothetical protein